MAELVASGSAGRRGPKHDSVRDPMLLRFHDSKANAGLSLLSRKHRSIGSRRRCLDRSEKKSSEYRSLWRLRAPAPAGPDINSGAGERSCAVPAAGKGRQWDCRLFRGS